ncbi:MAG TPA: hypothetical protein VFE50_06780 [Cyclobacteriaceae bacterium]|nr:hypothetical protein [Cyclobacteriaceae bacterium]
MKYLNYIDLGYQTIVLGLIALISIATAVDGHFEAIGVAGLYGGVFLGPWQMVSSLITVISRGLYLRWRVIHLLSAIGYIVGASVFAMLYGNADIDGVLKVFLGILGFGIPVGLALFYYYITYKSFRFARAQAKAVL